MTFTFLAGASLGAGSVSIGGFVGRGSALFALSGPSRRAMMALISSPCELDDAGAILIVCLGNGFGSLLRLLEGAFEGALDGRILSTGALDGKILGVGALVGRILVAGALDGKIFVCSSWLLNSRGSTSISA